MKKTVLIIGLCIIVIGLYFWQRSLESQPSIWQPEPGLTWQWQLNGPLNTSYNVDAYDIDLFDTSEESITALHDRGIKVICYFSAGTWEDWRSDANQFPTELIGNTLEDWPNEKWLDISKIDLLSPIMLARLDLAVQKGCDAVEPDNVDGYQNQSGFPLTANEQTLYNKWLAEQAHNRILAIGLKNDLDQITELVDNFDFAINEQCFQYDECDNLKPFIDQDKAVLGVEYESDLASFCPQAQSLNFSWLKMNYELGGQREACQ